MMLPGLGVLRRGLVFLMLGAAFVAGLKLGQSGQPDACHDAGGTWDPLGFCDGALP